MIKEIADREDVTCVVIGRITGDGLIILHDETDGTDPVRLPLDRILENYPQKTFEDTRVEPQLEPLVLPDDLTVSSALELVLKDVASGSKQFLMHKVDHSVGGLVIQAQQVGPNQLPISDHAIVAQSHFSPHGIAASIGEMPLVGLISAQAMPHMAFAEALLNMCGAKVTHPGDIKFSANWMVAAKLLGEGAWLYDAASSLSEMCCRFGVKSAPINPDGGKDSLSMAAKAIMPDGGRGTVIGPGQLVLSFYGPMNDVEVAVTSELKQAGRKIVLIDMANGKRRLGGSSLAYVNRQAGNECPDVEDEGLLLRGFQAVQEMVEQGLISAVHDTVGDGGIIVNLCEMAFAGNLGLDVDFGHSKHGLFETLFAQEACVIVECVDEKKVFETLRRENIPYQTIGKSVITSFCEDDINIKVN
jgi:phosphoribosylformylglycinamidine synthase